MTSSPKTKKTFGETTVPARWSALESMLTRPSLRRILLFSGVVSSVWYVATDVIASLRYPGYSYADQQISELMAVEAPTRSFMITMNIPYNLLVLAFAVGVWASAGSKRALRITAGLLAAYGAVGFVGLFFAPMHARGVEATMTLTDRMHIVVTSVIVLLTLLFIGVGAAARSRWFRLYSAATLLLLVAFGVVTALSGPQIAANEPTPWMGVTERLTIYPIMAWIAVLAVGLLRSEPKSSVETSGGKRYKVEARTGR
jgi:hypothetical protein